MNERTYPQAQTKRIERKAKLVDLMHDKELIAESRRSICMFDRE